MSVQIVGIGTAVPKHQIDQSDAAEQASQLCPFTTQQQRLLKALYMRAGVEKRHSVVLTASTNGHAAEQSFYAFDAAKPAGPTTAERMAAYDRFSAPLAIEAAARALADAGTGPNEITHLITVSCSGFSAPGFDLALIRQLPLRDDTIRTHVGFMGCQGALNGLHVARAFADSSPDACVLLCAVELCTLHHQYHWTPDQIVANALFADGAAAAIVRNARGNSIRETRSTDSSERGGNRPLMVVDQRSAVIPDSVDFIQWHVNDHGFEMSLSPQVPGLIERTLGSWLEAWLGEHDLSIDQIGSWAIHPGGPRIVAACAESITRARAAAVGACNSDHREASAGGTQAASKLAAMSALLADSEAVLADYGNMSSPTVLFILDRLLKRGAERPIVALAFGPGVAIEAALLQ
jgi:predicted naringenin-chalcone synthase